MFDEIRQRGVPINTFTFVSAIRSYIDMRRIDTVFPVMGHFIKIGHRPNTVILTALVDALFKAEKGPDALELFVRIVQLRLCEPDRVMIHTVIKRLCKDGQVDRAYNLLTSSEFTHWEPDLKSYIDVINGLCKAKKIEGAFDLLSEMIRKGVSPDAVTYTILIQGLCDATYMNDACIMLKKMESSGLVNTTTFNILINVYSKDGNTKMAGMLFQDIVEESELCPGTVTYTSLI